MNTRQRLNAKGIHNDYEFFGREPYIWLRPIDNTRAGAGSPAGWMVRKLGVNLQAHTSVFCRWDSGYQCRYFRYSTREDKLEALQQAQDFCRKRFGITQWKKSPFGSLGDASFVERRLKELLS